MLSDQHVQQAADRAAGLQLLEAAIRACGTATFLQGFLSWSVRLLSIIRSNKADHQVRRQASKQRQRCGLSYSQVKVTFPGVRCETVSIVVACPSQQICFRPQC